MDVKAKYNPKNAGVYLKPNDFPDEDEIQVNSMGRTGWRDEVFRVQRFF